MSSSPAPAIRASTVLPHDACPGLRQRARYRVGITAEQSDFGRVAARHALHCIHGLRLDLSGLRIAWVKRKRPSHGFRIRPLAAMEIDEGDTIMAAILSDDRWHPG
jgi:hypothetical protein